MIYSFRGRILMIFSITIFASFLLIIRNYIQTAEIEENVDSSEIQRLNEQLTELEQLLQSERRELELLNKYIDDRSRFHPKAIAKIHSKQNLDASLIRTEELPPWREPIAVLVFVCNRVEATKAHLNKLISYRTNKIQFPIIVSQDCDNKDLQEMVKEFGSDVQYIKHISSETARLKPPKEHRKFAVYYNIARHYKLGLNYMFGQLNYSSVIITEDDLDISHDFFDYFLATRPLLAADKSLFCVSAWNDNGKLDFINSSANSLLYRTDFFSGLGWMLTRELWEELESKWPPGFWDDFMREPEQRENRSCIRPEISRTAMTEFGRKGASKGLFFNRHLKRIVLNKEPAQFSKLNLSYLLHYDNAFLSKVYALPLVTVEELLIQKGRDWTKTERCRIGYESMQQFTDVARRIGIMADTKAGVARTAYLGIVSCFVLGKRVFIAPFDHAKWPGYDRYWEAPREVLDGIN